MMRDSEKKAPDCVVMGLGYIGLPTAVLLANSGLNVLGVDVSDKAVDAVKAGRLHFVEPGLGDLLKEAVEKGALRAAKVPQSANVYIIAVPTPFTGDHKPDLSYIKSAVSMLAPVLKKGDLIILESTSPVGTTEKIAQWLEELRPDLSYPQNAGEEADIQLAHCPERVLPGKIVEEMSGNDRIVGGMTKKAARMGADLYRNFVRGEIVLTSARAAEMSKLTENSFRDVNIAFANELSNICERLGIDVWELISLANRHPRVNILNPGCGVGGHCIAVDPWFIVDQIPEEALLIRQARETNDEKPRRVEAKIRRAAQKAAESGRPLKDIKIALLGLAYKPDIDDLRESPAVKIAKNLGPDFPGQVLAVEPNIKSLPEELESAGVRLASLDEALGADVTALLVPHKEFKSARPSKGTIFIDVTGALSQ